jgi:hydroxymethylbilane synthase
VRAERALNRHLNGGCQVPIACFAQLDDDGGSTLWLRALVGKPDGSVILRAEAKADSSKAEELGVAVAKDLLSQGAEAILAEVYAQ